MNGGHRLCASKTRTPDRLTADESGGGDSGHPGSNSTEYVQQMIRAKTWKNTRSRVRAEATRRRYATVTFRLRQSLRRWPEEMLHELTALHSIESVSIIDRGPFVPENTESRKTRLGLRIAVFGIARVSTTNRTGLYSWAK